MLLFSSISPLLFSILAELFSSLEVGAVYRVLSSYGHFFKEVMLTATFKVFNNLLC